jgi:hypothetical protein
MILAGKRKPRYGSGVVPGLNPIEQSWPQLKTHLRAKAARSLEALEAEPGQRPLDTITVQDAQGFTPPRRLPGSQ